VLSGRVCVNVSRVLEVGVSSVVTCDLNWVTAVEVLAVLHLVVVLHHWTVRKFDSALAVKLTLVDGVSAECPVESEGWLALAVDVVFVVLL